MTSTLKLSVSFVLAAFLICVGCLYSTCGKHSGKQCRIRDAFAGSCGIGRGGRWRLARI